MDDERVVLVGGPYDGKEVTIPAGRDVWRMLPPPQPMTFAGASDSAPMAELAETLNYRVLRDPTGRPSRRDDGRLVYELDVFGVSSHYRCQILVVDNVYPGGWPALVFCRCGVAVTAPNQRVLDDFQARHLLLDPTYGRDLK